jgi:hypothetical protein
LDTVTDGKCPLLGFKDANIGAFPWIVRHVSLGRTVADFNAESILVGLRFNYGPELAGFDIQTWQVRVKPKRIAGAIGMCISPVFRMNIFSYENLKREV